MPIDHHAIFKTRTAGAYGPLVLAPAEGMGALQAPCQFVICYFFLLFLNFFLKLFFDSFYLFYLFYLFFTCFTFFFFLTFLLFFFFFFYFLLFTTHFTTHFTTNFTTNHYQYCHPPPPRRFLYLRETQANVLRGHSPPQKSSCEKNLRKRQSRSRSRSRRSSDNLVLGF